MTDDELDAINEKISSLFTGKPLDEVATVLTIQLGMLVMQGSAGPDEAREFLDEITTEVEEMIESYDFADEEPETE
jgi:hypothetical protein